MTTVLVTRPKHQQKHFIALCHSLGLDTVSLPLLSINKCNVCPALWQHHFDNKNIAWVFTSKNAVIYSPFKQSPQGPLFAMGASTAKALKAAKHTLAAEPNTPFNSEALIKQLKNTSVKSAVVVTGIGGRAYLATELRSMGWDVTEVACYERIAEIHSLETTVQALNASDILSLTSIESMDVLLNLTAGTNPDTQLQWISKPLVVNSTRAVPAARKAGFDGLIEVAVPAGDEGQITAIKSLMRAKAHQPGL